MSLRFRISPFFTLIGGAVLFGILSGMTLDATFMGIVSGVGKVFSAFGIIILCGAVIAKILQEQHQIEEIVSDIRKYIKNPPVIAGLSGYLLAVPITCCVTAYVMLNPILDHLERDQQKRNVLLYLLAVGSIISYALISLTPVVIPLFDAFGGGTSLVFLTPFPFRSHLLCVSFLSVPDRASSLMSPIHSSGSSSAQPVTP